MAFKGDRATTAIYIRIKRFAETYFVLCDEYETVEGLKGRLLAVLDKIGFQLPKQEEPLCSDDIRFCLKNRVSFRSVTVSIDSRQGLHVPRPTSVQRYGALLAVPQAGNEGRVR